MARPRKLRPPVTPIGMGPELEIKQLRDTVRDGLAAMTEQFLDKRMRYLAKAMEEEDLDRDEWSIQMDEQGVRFVRAKRTRRRGVDGPVGDDYDTSIKPLVKESEPNTQSREA